MLSYEKLSDVPGYGNYYVGFIDILGFKELVNRCFGGDDGRLHTTLCKVFEDLPHYFKGEPSSFYESYESGEPMPKTGTLWMSPYIDEIFDLSFFFSDSIILCTKKSNNIDDDVKRLVTLCSIMSRYVKLLLLNPIDGRTFAVKLRGAIASGPAVIFPATKRNQASLRINNSVFYPQNKDRLCQWHIAPGGQYPEPSLYEIPLKQKHVRQPE